MSITLGTGSEYVFQNFSTKFHCGARFKIKSLVNPTKIRNWIRNEYFLALVLLISAIKKKLKVSDRNLLLTCQINNQNKSSS